MHGKWMEGLRILFKSMERPLHMNFSELKTLTCECYLIDKKDI